MTAFNGTTYAPGTRVTIVDGGPATNATIQVVGANGWYVILEDGADKTSTMHHSRLEPLAQFVAVDDENGRVFGPFGTQDEAVAWAVEVMYATGEWDKEAGMGRSNDWDDLNDAGWGIIELMSPPAPISFKESK